MPPRTRARTRKLPSVIRVWDDDPMAVGDAPVEGPAPKMPGGRLKVGVDVPGPPAGVYEPGTPEFRWWLTADALARGEAAWPDENGELPDGATYEIVVDEHGRRTVRRRRFSTG